MNYKNYEFNENEGQEWNMQDAHLKTLATNMARVAEAIATKEAAEAYYSLLALMAYSAVNLARENIEFSELHKEINAYGSVIKSNLTDLKVYQSNTLAHKQRISQFLMQLMALIDKANVIYPKKEFKTITEVIEGDF